MEDDISAHKKNSPLLSGKAENDGSAQLCTLDLFVLSDIKI